MSVLSLLGACYATSRRQLNDPDPEQGDLDGLLRVGGVRSHEEAEGKDNEASDNTGPYDHLLTSVLMLTCFFSGAAERPS